MTSRDIQALLDSDDDEEEEFDQDEVFSSRVINGNLRQLQLSSLAAEAAAVASVRSGTSSGSRIKSNNMNTSFLTIASPNLKVSPRELDIERILRETDECDDLDDVVNSILHQAHHAHQARQPHSNGVLVDSDDDQDHVLKDEASLSSTEEFIKQHQTYRQQFQQRNTALPESTTLPSSSEDEESLPSSLEEEDDEDGEDYLSKSTISTKLTNANGKPSTMSSRFSRAASLETNTVLSATNTNTTAHNPQEWAVLQAILAENDDDDEEHDHNVGNGISNGPSKSPIYKGTSSNRAITKTQLDVDAILQSMDDDDEDYMMNIESNYNYDDDIDDVDDEELLDYTLSKTAVHDMSNGIGHRPAQDSTLTTLSAGVNHATNQLSTRNASTLLPLGVYISPTSPEGKDWTTISDSITSAAMTQAQFYESRLLRGYNTQSDALNKSPGVGDQQFQLVSPLSVKRRMKPKLELFTKSRQKQAKVEKSKTTPLKEESSQVSRFNFSGILDVTPLPDIGKNMTRAAASAPNNLPTALAVSPKFLCLGTQSGMVYVYDMFQSLRQTIASPVPTSSVVAAGSVAFRKGGVSVTSMDLSTNGEALLVGYSNGTLILWDTLTGKVLRHCTDVHSNSPITSVRYVSPYTDASGNTLASSSGGSTSNEGIYSCISVDASGLVNKCIFTKSLVSNLWGGGGYSVEVECLLDGTAGQILSLEILPPLSHLEQELRHIYEVKQHFMRRVVLIGLSSAKSSFVVAVEPNIQVLHRWSRLPPATTETKQEPPPPSPSTSTKPYLPCLAWGWSLVSGGGNVVHPILARAWDTSLQMLRANYIEPVDAETTEVDTVGRSANHQQQWPAFGVLSDDEFETDHPVLSLEWINERSLAYLTANSEFTIIDTVCMTLLERVDFSGYQLVYAEMKLAGTPKGEMSTTFANSIRSCVSDHRLYVTCQHSLLKINLQSTKTLILDKEANGEWLQALALALDYYENYVKVLEDRLRQRADWDSRGRDMRWHPEFMRGGGTAADADEWITSLLLRYLKLAVENAPISTSARRRPTSDGRIDLTLSHFTMLAGVCVEYCIGTRRLQVLFQQVYPTFRQIGYEGVFFDVLQPYILKDSLKYFSPEVMAAFVEHCKRRSDIEGVERCLLHLDVTIMDFDSILPLLRSNEMYSALLHVFTLGLDDYVSPLEILLEGLMDAAEQIGPDVVNLSRRLDGVFQNRFERFGYKALLYLQYCFQGKTFPGGLVIEPEDRLQSLRPELLKFLLQPSYNPSSTVLRNRRAGNLIADTVLVGRRSDPYPYLSILVMVDAKALLDVFSFVLDANDVDYEESSFEYESELVCDMDVMQPCRVALVEEHDHKEDGSKSNLCPDRQQIVAILASVIRPTETSDGGCGRQAMAAKNAFLGFVAKYLERRIIRAPKSLTFAVLSRMSKTSSILTQDKKECQEKIVSLLQALPPNSYDLDKVLPVMESAGMTKVSLVLHKVGASKIFDALSKSQTHNGSSIRAVVQDSVAHFARAIECFVEDTRQEIYKKHQVFDYVKAFCSRADVSSFKSSVTGEINVPEFVRHALIEKISDLVRLDAVLSTQLVAELFVDNLDSVLATLEASTDGQALFDFLQAVISGHLRNIDPVAGPVLEASLSMMHHHMYLKLMADLHPEMVYKYLLTHNTYRADECLKLCQAREIADASAYLLERMGNVSSALQLLLQTLESRLMALKRVVRGIIPTPSKGSTGWRHRVVQQREDKVAFLKKQSEIQKVTHILTVALDLCERNSGSKGNQKELRSQLWFNVLDRLVNAQAFLRLEKEQPQHLDAISNCLSDLLQLTMQRMVSNVPLKDLLRKLTIDHSGHQLGEFRHMLMSLLKTYSGDLQIASCAVNVMHTELKDMTRKRGRLKVRGMGVNAVMGQDLGEIGSSSFNENKATIIVTPNGDADLKEPTMAHISVPFDAGESSRTAALARLKKRRQLRNRGDLKQCQTYKSRSSIAHMTQSEQSFHNSHGEWDVLPRQVGILTEAEHFGQLG